tara:strand:- start:5307 stop:5714 length:408 start_codon:yes stop_codon:yes gene_type:complete
MGEKREIEEIYSKAIRAGRRTYFFDVRSTRARDYYLTITESKRDFNEDGTPFYKKHKIYLYKEDFSNFKDALTEFTDYIIKEKGEEIISLKKEEQNHVKDVEEKEEKEKKEASSTDFTEVNFDELGEDDKNKNDK